MAENMGSSGGSTRDPVHSNRPMPNKLGDDFSSGGGARQYDQNPDPPMGKLRPSIDKSGTSEVSGSVPATRPSGSQPDHERAG